MRQVHRHTTKMHSFEKKIVDLVKGNASGIKEYVDTKSGNVIRVKKDEPELEFGPLTSTNASMEVFNAIYETVERQEKTQLGENELPSVSMFPNSCAVLNLEHRVADVYVPTAIKNAIGELLEIDDDEATQVFLKGPERYGLMEDDFRDVDFDKL